VSEDPGDRTAPGGAPDRTAPGGAPDRTAGRSIMQRTLDGLVFAPAGFMLTALDDLPEMAAKGRTRLEGQFRNAHVLGQFAVTYGRRDLGRRLGQLTRTRERPPTRSPSTSGPADVAGTPSAPAGPHVTVSEAAPTAGEDGRPTRPQSPATSNRLPGAQGRRGDSAGSLADPLAPPPGAHLAIPDYDTLSASQVVRRLDGLGHRELEAVYRHETATRGRRTIIHRAQQLLGSEDLPGR